VLNGRIRISSDDYPRVGDFFARFEPVEYRGPVVRDGRRSTERCAVFLLRVDARGSAEVSVYFEQVTPRPKASPVPQ
jgi:hypothetical protein